MNILKRSLIHFVPYALLAGWMIGFGETLHPAAAILLWLILISTDVFSYLTGVKRAVMIGAMAHHDILETYKKDVAKKIKALQAELEAAKAS